jgi:hypothetical protein
MACILKPPSGDALGVVSLTTQERDRFIRRDPALREQLRSLKSRWLVGLHHNWHDVNFAYDPVFDFSMAGHDDLRESSGREFPLVPLDACNFCPVEFHPGGDKFWDLLFVAHPVYFKRVPVLFDTIRELFDRGLDVRALHICPMPPYTPSERRTVLYDVRDRYEAMFDARERRLFTLMTTDWDYPFPYDLPTLAHFYRSSRVFIHTADEERRCRVAAYAWAAGLPVVAMRAVGSVLPSDLRREPWFFEVGPSASYADRVVGALEAQRRGFDPSPAASTVNPQSTLPQLNARLAEVCAVSGRRLSDLALVSPFLDIRLGRHHGLGSNPNSVPQTLTDFMSYLAVRSDSELQTDVAVDDPERAIAELPQWHSARGEVEAGLDSSPEPTVLTRWSQRVTGKSRLLLRRAKGLLARTQE